MQIFLYYFFTLSFYLFIFLALSKLIYNIIKFEFYNKAGFYFKKIIELTTSITISIVFYALFQTKGYTINLGLLFLLIFALAIYKPKFKINFKLDFSKKATIRFFEDFLFMLILILPIFLFHFLSIYNFEEGLKIPNADYFHYARSSNILTLSGHENSFLGLNLIYPEATTGVTPYHYFEIWLTAILNLFNQNALLTLRIITYPILTFIVYIGSIAIIEKYYKITFLLIISSYFILFIGTSYYHNFSLFSDYIFQNLFYFHTTPFSYFGKKLIPIYVWSILAINFFIRKHYRIASLLLLTLPLINISQLPGAIGLYFLIWLYLSIKKRNKFFFIKEIIVGIGFVIFLLGILYFLKPEFENSLNTKNSLFVDFNSGSLIYHFKQIIKKIITLFFIYLPHLIASTISLVLLWKSNKDIFIFLKKIAVLIFIFLSSSLFFTEIINLKANGIQFFSNSLVYVNLFFGIIFLLSIIDFIKKKKYLYLISLLLFLFLITGSFKIYLNQYKNDKALKTKYSKTYISEVSEALNKTSKNALIGYLINNKETKSIYFNNTFILIPGDNIKLNGFTNLIFLNNPYKLPYLVKRGKQEDVLTLKIGELYYYIEKQKEKNSYISFEKSQLEFIKQNKVKAIICSPNTIFPNSILNIKRVIKDNKSGEATYILKDEKNIIQSSLPHR